MPLVKRIISDKLAEYLKLFPVVVIVGPRHSGKTTFAKMELSLNGDILIWRGLLITAGSRLI